MTSQGEVRPQCKMIQDENKADIANLDRIVRGSNGEGLTTKIKLLQDKVDAILFWQRAALLGILGLVIERLAEWFM